MHHVHAEPGECRRQTLAVEQPSAMTAVGVVSDFWHFDTNPASADHIVQSMLPRLPSLPNVVK
ncbi:hypothetical protein ACQP2P_32080 [Dactylosporangium sp. CA-139114]|uniref:hypothetical protein n=1 Tax=Dactylosporangium sp. CA-139114 TaxID=3239931 RepID=UPI003D970F77